LSVVQRKAKRLDQVERRLRSQTKPADIARVRRNLRLDQNDVEHRVSTADYADVPDKK